MNIVQGLKRSVWMKNPNSHTPYGQMTFCYGRFSVAASLNNYKLLEERMVCDLAKGYVQFSTKLKTAADEQNNIILKKMLTEFQDLCIGCANRFVN